MWLERLFGDSCVPQYEVNDRTLGILHQLKYRNEHVNTCSGLICDDLYQKAKEYKTEGIVHVRDVEITMVLTS